jgi:uncharacterized protein HemY
MRKLALLVATLAAAVGASSASAHNAGHIYIDGRCLGVGSSRRRRSSARAHRRTRTVSST